MDHRSRSTPEPDRGDAEGVLGCALREADFRALRELIHRETGIALSDSKQHLVHARLSKRLRHLQLPSFAAYVDLVTSPEAGRGELLELINAITTNKTAFFREPQHFDFLRERLIPEAEERARRTGQRHLRVWSAGCSTGEEPYTIALVLAEHLQAIASWEVSILATDIDTEVLRRAEEGVYDDTQLEAIPASAASRFLRRGKGSQAGTFAIHPDLRRMVHFRRLNFIDQTWPLRARFDAIFCRNVLIYFDRLTQTQVYHRLHRHLEPDGYFFGGHSENLHGLEDIFAPVGGTVYRPVGARRSLPPRRSLFPGAASPRRSTRPPGPARRRVDIHVGQVFAAAEPTMIRTLLGSCVAVCLFDPVARVGGMNHFAVAHEDGEVPSARSGPGALTALLAELERLGARRSRMRAKVFGAGHVLPDTATTVPDGNSRIARSILAAIGIPIAAERLDVDHGLDVRFYTDTGQAFIKPVPTAGSAAGRPRPRAGARGDDRP
jgi:chemotaxis protein methyltransferase CheR